MKRILLTSVAALTLSASAGLAQSATDQIVSGLQAQGFTRIEIDEGPTQIKVEAIRDTTKVEYVYDRRTGAVLSQEVEAVAGDDDTSPGVEVRRDGDDFVGRNGRSNDDGPNHDVDDDGFGHDDDNDDGGIGHDDDDDDDGLNHDDDDDDDDDDNGGSGSGGADGGSGSSGGSDSDDDDDDDGDGGRGQGDDDD